MSRDPVLSFEDHPSYEQGIGSVLADLSVTVGHIREAVSGDRLRKPVIPWQACHPVGPIAALSGSGTYDQPDMLGPKDPYWWDLRRFAAWGFTAGTVNLYKNGTANQLGSLAAPGNITWSLQELMGPRDRLVVVATGITGNVQFEIRAIEIESAWLPEYLV